MVIPVFQGEAEVDIHAGKSGVDWNRRGGVDIYGGSGLAPAGRKAVKINGTITGKVFSRAIKRETNIGIYPEVHCSTKAIAKSRVSFAAPGSHLQLTGIFAVTATKTVGVDQPPSARLVMDCNQRAGLRRYSTVDRHDGLVAVGERCRNHHVDLKFARCYQAGELDGSRDATDLNGWKRR